MTEGDVSVSESDNPSLEGGSERNSSIMEINVNDGGSSTVEIDSPATFSPASVSSPINIVTEGNVHSDPNWFPKLESRMVIILKGYK